MQFMSQQLKEFATMCGIQLKHTTSYHPLSNGIVERFHRTLKTAISAHNHTKWTESLPTVLLGLRSSIYGTSNYSIAQMVFGKTIRLPDRPEIWFYQVEAQFSINGISQEMTKFNYLVAQLEPHLVENLWDIIQDPQNKTKYSSAKDRLITIFKESEEKKLRRLLTGLELGDLKPSQLLRKMKILKSKEDISDKVIRTLWMDKLPENIKNILVVSKEDLDSFAEMADKIQEISPQAQTFETEKNPNWKEKVITGDETWVYGYDPETKRQSMEWKGKDEPRTKKFRLCKDWISRYGTPCYLITDRSMQFMSQQLKEFATMCGIQLKHTTSYHPLSNGIVERFHRTLKTAISAHNHTKWTESLPTVLLGLRSSIYGTSNYSIAQMVFGKTIRLPASYQTSRQSSHENASSHSRAKPRPEEFTSRRRREEPGAAKLFFLHKDLYKT
ncbi:hypothetical protein LAZ67_19002069 [Cordylochernes scorpioides]|uniref:Integrase catalytic domain-containing protein n=1 Tax=Cordylochernes scorpioides TaxID=51811 RepID=A0ABY6LM02_9ARAC|nr:hypothetical protein LAZ67_19002069 [Cordylochernes scorpioides]